MRNNRKALVLLALASLLLSPLARSASIRAVLANPKQYDRQLMTVSGTVSALQQHLSRRGNAYETFAVCAYACIHIFTFGEPVLHNNEKVTVTGNFAAVKQVGRYTFYNEIDAEASGVRPVVQ